MLLDTHISYLLSFSSLWGRIIDTVQETIQKNCFVTNRSEFHRVPVSLSEIVAIEIMIEKRW